MIVTSKLLTAATCCLVLIYGATVQAGTLAGNAFAYNDGNGPLAGAWTGSSPFANGDLAGTVDWAVFTAGTFNSLFSGGGYVAPAGELVYAHQIFTYDAIPPVVGSTGMTIDLAGNPAGNGGSFSAGGVGGVDLLSLFVDPSIADFTLVAETDVVTPSDGLVYSSPNRPRLTGIPTLIDGGTSADCKLPIGVPGSNEIPEPATWIVGSAAMMLLFGSRRGYRLA